MVDLLTLTPRKDKFELGGGESLDIVPLTLRQITQLLERFDGLGELATRPLIEVLRDAGGAAAGAIIAAGVGQPGNRNYEAKAAELDFATQVDLVDAIIRLSMPKGGGPLAKGLSDLVGQIMPIMTAQAAIAAASLNSSPAPTPSSPANGAGQNPPGT